MNRTIENITNTEYNYMLSLWELCARAFSGEKAIKALGTLYLQAPPNFSAKEYATYKKRAWF